MNKKLIVTGLILIFLMVGFSGCNDSSSNDDDLFYQEVQLIVDELYPITCSSLSSAYSKLSTYSIGDYQLSSDTKEDKENIEEAFLEIENGYNTCFNDYPDKDCILLSSAQNVYLATFYLGLVKNSLSLRQADSDEARESIEEKINLDNTELRSFFYMDCASLHTMIKSEYESYMSSITSVNDDGWDELEKYLSSKDEYISDILTSELESFELSESYQPIKENISGLLLAESLYVTSLSGLRSAKRLGDDQEIQKWTGRSTDAFNGITNVLISIDKMFGTVS